MTAKKDKQPQQKAPKNRLANVLLILGLGIFLVGEGYCGYKLYTLSNEQEQIAEDYATVNSITFGVFSVDLWRDKISHIVTKEIKGFKITEEQKKEIRKDIETQLHAMISKVTKEITKPQKGIGNKLKKFAFKQFVDPKEIHAQVPSFANTIVNRITSQRATNKLKNIATDKFDKLVDQTFDSTKVAIYQVTKQVYKKYHVNNQQAFNKQIETKLNNSRKVTYNYAYAMLGCVAMAFVAWVILRKKTHLHSTLFIMSLLFALALLIIGVTVSIIEVDARLSSFEFLMMGEKVVFENQVLFFQSKSILGIGEVLIQQPKPDAITVGIIIILFVIILPILRITARGIHMLCKPIIAENGITRYLTFESGKWDMADVMVVGILMTYIGLNGILKSQLSGLNMKDEFLRTATVNYTSLQPGFIIFVGYVAFGFFLSFMLKQITCNTK
ncbi:2-methylisocitrate lyase [Pedobacter frigiditerrae]|uniref:2-methylisocitrate lyase n=1 Tax=Pedobacter frigiditerrae TaxID=2530452 RepID=A0A4R0MVJ4_9SPHI|nr:paraquat-inducible protein A [Pedobacter frigiditerrae]TCC90222.1 2-methylisocitrate lyase [Pedobacter frigiditerrae]